METFDLARKHRDLQQLIEPPPRAMGVEARQAVAAYGMLIGTRSAPVGTHHEDAVAVLDFLGFTKAALHRAARHSEPTISATAALLTVTQQFVAGNLVPCTE